MKIKIPTEISNKYKLPAKLTEFQLALYIHLIEWKWKHITKEPGKHGKTFYDAILPQEFQEEGYPLYSPLVEEIRNNHKFKLHLHFGHMASSQAACINLFTPLLLMETVANQVLPSINPKFSSLATSELEGGFQFEFWPESNPLNDHTEVAGTDSDIAIAYYGLSGDLCLWLIEHKLSEDEFTTCGGYKSKGNQKKTLCKNGPGIINDRSKCYYHSSCQYKYWDITHKSNLFILNLIEDGQHCPFKDGKNQLWRNQLMAFAIQEEGKYKHVHFSVVHHPDNHDLRESIDNYKTIIRDPGLFSVFTARDVIKPASLIKYKYIQDWVAWYSDLYMI